MTKSQTLSALLCGSIGAVVVLVSQSFFRGPLVMGDEKARKSEILEVRELRLVDEHGKVRATLTNYWGRKEKPTYEDKPGLYLFSPEGRLIGSFNVGDDRGWLNINGRNGGGATVGVTKLQPDGYQGGMITVSDNMLNMANLGSWLGMDGSKSPVYSIRFMQHSPEKKTWLIPDEVNPMKKPPRNTEP